MYLRPASLVFISALIAIGHITAIYAQAPSSRTLENAQTIPVDAGRAVGPESFAFDPLGEGPYTGISDGRIIKWLKNEKKWINFATTVSERTGCDGTFDKGAVCGRTLGLKFNAKTGDLYICDAQLGLFVVGPKGGLATKLVSEANGVPLKFVNGIDIDQQTGIVYFTDSSTVVPAIDGNNTGRFLKYDPGSKQLTVLLTDMPFPNGVAISRDNSFVVIASTTSKQLLKYSLNGESGRGPQLFASLPEFFVDNVKRNKNGEFWVGGNAAIPDAIQARYGLSQNRKLGMSFPRNGDSDQVSVAIKLSEDGKILETLDDKFDGVFTSVSEVEETDDGTLWIGSVALPFAGVSSTA